MVNFNFSEECLEIVSQEKCFSCYILLTDQISLPDYLYFLRYWVICVLQLSISPGYDVINFENNFIFLIKPLSWWESALSAKTNKIDVILATLSLTTLKRCLSNRNYSLEIFSNI